MRWVGDHDLHTSLSIINQEVVGRLRGDAGLRLQRVERTGVTNDPPLAHLADVEVRHQWPPDFSPAPGGRLAVIQPWEFGAIPADWVEPIERNVDELWVPSEFVRRMYIDSGIDAERVHVVPNGVDLDRFTPDGPRLDIDAPGVRLLFVGGLIRRKGPDVLLHAYREAFAGRDDVTLVVKDFGADGIYAGTDRDGLRELRGRGHAPARRAPRGRAVGRGDGRAVPRLRRPRAPVPRRGLRHAGARGDGLRPAGGRHRRRPDRRVLPAGRRVAHPRASAGRCRTAASTSGSAPPCRGCSSPTRATSPS